MHHEQKELRARVEMAVRRAAYLRGSSLGRDISPSLVYYSRPRDAAAARVMLHALSAPASLPIPIPTCWAQSSSRPPPRGPRKDQRSEPPSLCVRACRRSGSGARRGYNERLGSLRQLGKTALDAPDNDGRVEQSSGGGSSFSLPTLPPARRAFLDIWSR